MSTSTYYACSNLAIKRWKNKYENSFYPLSSHVCTSCPSRPQCPRWVCWGACAAGESRSSLWTEENLQSGETGMIIGMDVTSIRVTNKRTLKYKGITQHLMITPPLSTGGRSVCVHPPWGGLEVPPALHTVPEEAGGRAGQQLRHQVRASDRAGGEAEHAATCDSSSHATLRGGILLHRSALYPPSSGTNWSTRCTCLRPGDQIRIE